MRQSLAIVFAVLSSAAFAQSTADVPLPRERPSPEAAVPMPRERPPALEASSASAEPASSSVQSPLEAPSSLEPPSSAETTPSTESSSSAESPPPPPRDYQIACPSAMNGQVTAKPLPPIHDGQCGLNSPLSLEAVEANGRSIPLNAPVTTDCGVASALPGWLSAVDSYVTAHEKTRIKTLDLGTGYDCRNVDHAAVGNLSFHSFGDAVDVIGFSLEDGRKVSIAPGFNGTQEQGHDILHYARDAACSSFMTVISPDGDAYHQDNMHLDLACHGKSCTTRLCQ
jgi:hypothetical protein